MSKTSAASRRWVTAGGSNECSSRRADAPDPAVGPAARTRAAAASGRSASCSGCSRPSASVPTTAHTSGLAVRCCSKISAACPPSGASAGNTTMASTGVWSAWRSPATRAAAGPPPTGSSRTKVAGRRMGRSGPTMINITSAGSASMARSSSGTPSTTAASLSVPKRRDSPPASTTAATRPMSAQRPQASASRIGISLATDSASSASGSDPATMPHPANNRICRGSVSLIRPHRRAIPHSPSPRASTQPTGPV